MSRITLHMVASLDGIIARKDNTVSWLDTPADAYEKGVSEPATGDAGDAIDCFVLGSRTYEHALELGWPYGDTPTIVTTHRTLTSDRPSVEFYAGDLARLAGALREKYQNIWLVGGAMLSQQFLERGLVDEIRLAIVPVILGDGLRLFGESPETRWRLENVTAYKTGVVELLYGAEAGI